ncbi:hypothetical protein DFH27DRAFT_542796 [Peziza echinospora]|nr:hypothetical protein DFH27DRAFT_542796 [Peziza echinospora]
MIYYYKLPPISRTPSPPPEYLRLRQNMGGAALPALPDDDGDDSQGSRRAWNDSFGYETDRAERPKKRMKRGRLTQSKRLRRASVDWSRVLSDVEADDMEESIVVRGAVLTVGPELPVSASATRPRGMKRLQKPRPTGNEQEGTVNAPAETAPVATAILENDPRLPPTFTITNTPNETRPVLPPVVQKRKTVKYVKPYSKTPTSSRQRKNPISVNPAPRPQPPQTPQIPRARESSEVSELTPLPNVSPPIPDSYLNREARRSRPNLKNSSVGNSHLLEAHANLRRSARTPVRSNKVRELQGSPSPHRIKFYISRAEPITPLTSPRSLHLTGRDLVRNGRWMWERLFDRIQDKLQFDHALGDEILLNMQYPIDTLKDLPEYENIFRHCGENEIMVIRTDSTGKYPEWVYREMREKQKGDGSTTTTKSGRRQVATSDTDSDSDRTIDAPLESDSEEWETEVPYLIVKAHHSHSTTISKAYPPRPLTQSDSTNATSISTTAPPSFTITPVQPISSGSSKVVLAPTSESQLALSSATEIPEQSTQVVDTVEIPEDVPIPEGRAVSAFLPQPPTATQIQITCSLPESTPSITDHDEIPEAIFFTEEDPVVGSVNSSEAPIYSPVPLELAIVEAPSSSLPASATSTTEVINPRHHSKSPHLPAIQREPSNSLALTITSSTDLINPLDNSNSPNLSLVQRESPTPLPLSAIPITDLINPLNSNTPHLSQAHKEPSTPNQSSGISKMDDINSLHKPSTPISISATPTTNVITPLHRSISSHLSNVLNQKSTPPPISNTPNTDVINRIFRISRTVPRITSTPRQSIPQQGASTNPVLFRRGVQASVPVTPTPMASQPSIESLDYQTHAISAENPDIEDNNPSQQDPTKSPTLSVAAKKRIRLVDRELERELDLGTFASGRRNIHIRSARKFGREKKLRKSDASLLKKLSIANNLRMSSTVDDVRREEDSSKRGISEASGNSDNKNDELDDWEREISPPPPLPAFSLPVSALAMKNPTTHIPFSPSSLAPLLQTISPPLSSNPSSNIAPSISPSPSWAGNVRVGSETTASITTSSKPDSSLAHPPQRTTLSTTISTSPETDSSVSSAQISHQTAISATPAVNTSTSALNPSYRRKSYNAATYASANTLTNSNSNSIIAHGANNNNVQTEFLPPSQSPQLIFGVNSTRKSKIRHTRPLEPDSPPLPPLPESSNMPQLPQQSQLTPTVQNSPPMELAQLPSSHLPSSRTIAQLIQPRSRRPHSPPKARRRRVTMPNRSARETGFLQWEDDDEDDVISLSGSRKVTDENDNKAEDFGSAVSGRIRGRGSSRKGKRVEDIDDDGLELGF